MLTSFLQVGGFKLPFFALGGFTLVTLIVIYLVLPKGKVLFFIFQRETGKSALANDIMSII